MSNLSYNKLIERYTKLKQENKEEFNSLKERYYYYFNGYQKQKEDNDLLINENKRLKKENVELSYLITELMKKGG